MTYVIGTGCVDVMHKDCVQRRAHPSDLVGGLRGRVLDGGEHRRSARGQGDRRPDGVDDETVEAAGSVSEALEYVERARGHLYSFHQLIGHADLLLGEACDKLRAAGHDAVADRLE